MVRVATRHSANGIGVSILEATRKPNQQKSCGIYHNSHIHLTKDVCRYTVGYVLQQNPVTMPLIKR